MKPIICHTLLTAAFGICGLLISEVKAEEIAIRVEIPQLNVAEYHRPYIAIWIESEGQKHAGDLAVWYQMRDSAEGQGTKWLPDLRQWWRKSGRTLKVPIDGITGATRPAGVHELTYKSSDSAFGKLSPGQYALVIEAAREVGGREMLRLPFSWPPTSETTADTTGARELGKLSLTVKP